MDVLEVEALLKPPMLDDCKKVLCIQPHPDDNEIGMGGIIRMLANKGCEIHYLTVTDGRLGDFGTPYSPEELAAIRRLEATEAGRYLGATKFFWFEYKDGTLFDIPKLAGEIGELIRKEQYDTIFSPDPWLVYESHHDHIVTGKASSQAAISCALKTYPEGTLSPPCSLQGVGFYFTALPNTIVDISGYFEDKFRAMSLHKTQLNDELLSLYRTYFMMRGDQLMKGKGIGEGVKMLRPIHLHAFPEAMTI